MKTNGNFEEAKCVGFKEGGVMGNCECGGACGECGTACAGNACGTLQGACVSLMSAAQTKLARARQDESGQGTTEYAILVGVLVVIAILAITVFRGKIQELWSAISDGIMGL